jgi:DNA primase
LLEQGFEAKVLALPGGLDPDSFIRRQGAEAYRERLAGVPTYLDYLTERAAAEHDLERPEGKVAAANAVMPYLAKVPNAMLRSELANRVAERFRLDERLLREELRRAAGEGRREMRVQADAAVAKATPAEKQLLRAFMESEELADEFLAQLVESGDCEGLATEGIFRSLLEARREGESIEPSRLEGRLSPEEQRILFESAFWSGEPPDRDEALACFQALRRRRAEREREKLQMEIQAAEREKDLARLAKLLEAKAKLAKELAQLKGL